MFCKRKINQKVYLLGLSNNCPMPLSVPFPSIESGSTKDLVLAIMAIREPSSAREIHNALKRTSPKSITYHGVFKHLNQMVNQGVLKKEARNYSIRLEWVRGLREFSERVEAALVRREAVDLLAACEMSGGIYTRTFSSASELDPHIHEIIVRMKGETIVTETPYLWWALLYSRRMLEEQSFRATHEKIYTICHGDTPVDRWCARVENELGMHAKTGVGGAPASQILVVSDYVVQYYYPTAVHEAIRALYSSARHLTPLIRDRVCLSLQRIFNQRADVSVVVTKNAVAAERIRSNVMRHFGRR